MHVLSWTWRRWRKDGVYGQAAHRAWLHRNRPACSHLYLLILSSHKKSYWTQWSSVSTSWARGKWQEGIFWYLVWFELMIYHPFSPGMYSTEWVWNGLSLWCTYSRCDLPGLSLWYLKFPFCRNKRFCQNSCRSSGQTIPTPVSLPQKLERQTQLMIYQNWPPKRAGRS